MQQLLTPKQVAQAIGVSESSLKRWCDKGVIPFEKTAGGHRRLPLSGVMSYLRQSGHTVVEPEVIGLPSNVGKGQLVIDRARQQFREALLSGKEQTARQVLFNLFLAQHSIADIVDNVISQAFAEIGEDWECGKIDVYEERRGCQVTQRLMTEIAAALPPANPDAPIAIGGTLARDHYTLATTAVELVLRDCGWNAMLMGTNLPSLSLVKAIEDYQPRLVWLSSSYIEDREQFVRDMRQINEACQARETSLVLGGSAVDHVLLERIECSRFCTSMKDLVTFVEELPNRNGHNGHA